MTMRECFVKALEVRGHRLAKTTFKFLVYTRKDNTFYYIGAAGSLRAGRTVQSSIPCSQKFKDLLIAAASAKTNGGAPCVTAQAA